MDRNTKALSRIIINAASQLKQGEKISNAIKMLDRVGFISANMAQELNERNYQTMSEIVEYVRNDINRM